MDSAQDVFWSDQSAAAMRDRLDLLTDGRTMTEAEKHGARLMLLTITPELVRTDVDAETLLVCARGIVSAWVEYLK